VAAPVQAPPFHEESSSPQDRFDLRAYFVEIMLQERIFLALLGAGFLAVGATYQNAEIARWLGFLFAGYAAVANDSIQTIGTFIASNSKQKWWVLWLFIGGLFLVTAGYSFVTYDGDVSYQRLLSKGFEQAPASFTYLQVAAPLFLLILTRLRMPVSTTFLLLSSFAASASSVGSVLTKSLSGYAVAFTIAVVVWGLLGRAMAGWFKGEPSPLWRPLQWLSSGALWCVWLMQDAANIAVYLPRQLNPMEFVAFAGVIFLGLGWLFRSGGERIQEIVNEKADVVDVRFATVIDFVYALILYYFKAVSNIPMSTTWVFLGLLGGRELVLALTNVSGRRWTAAAKMLGRDVLFAGIGLAVSLVLAMSVNPLFYQEMLSFLGL
jgi:hypothetical protein